MYITYVSIDGDLYCTKTVFVKCNLPLNEDETNKKRYVNNINYICETADHFQWHFWFHSHRVICALISQQNTMSHVVIKCVCAYYTTFVRIWLCHVRKLFVCWHFAEAIRAHDGLCVYLCLPYDKTVYQQPTNLIELRINKRERCVRTEGDIKKKLDVYFTRNMEFHSLADYTGSSLGMRRTTCPWIFHIIFFKFSFHFKQNWQKFCMWNSVCACR